MPKNPGQASCFDGSGAWYTLRTMSSDAAKALGPCPHCGENHPEDMLVCPNTQKYLPLEGRLLSGKFRFVKMLGEGGMGSVWRARHELVHKDLAIKLMHPEFASNPNILERFRNEATAAGRIGNAHICDILDFGKSALGPYIVMEMLRGKPLDALIEEMGQVDPALATMVIRQALEGLHAAHEVGIVHRDLKPENIFLNEPEPGRVLIKLMDFGISKFTQGQNDGRTGVGVLMGTPEYMSPEQAEGAANVDERTDIWAMGAILYQALTGKQPFSGNTMAATLVALATKDPTPISELAPNVPPELEAIVNKCLAKMPEQRYQSVKELSDALLPFDQPGAIAMPTLAPPRTLVPNEPTPAPQQVNTGAATVVTGMGPPPGGGNTQLSMGNNWEIGDDDRPPSSLGGRRESGGGKGGIIAVALLLVVGGAGAAFWFMQKDPGPAAIVATDTGDEKADSAGESAGDEQKAGDTGESAGDEQNASDTAADKPPEDTAGDKTAGETAATGADSGDEDSGDEDSGDEDSGDEDSGGDTKTKKRRPRPDMSLLVKSGSLYTHKKPGTTGSLSAAKGYCSSLKKKKYGKLSRWRLASVGEVLKFRGKSEIKRFLYWTNTKASAGKGKAVLMVTGKPTERPVDDNRARPFCVAKS